MGGAQRGVGGHNFFGPMAPLFWFWPPTAPIVGFKLAPSAIEEGRMRQVPPLGQLILRIEGAAVLLFYTSDVSTDDQHIILVIKHTK